MKPMKALTAIAIGAVAAAVMVAPSQALTRIASSHGVAVQQGASAGVISSKPATKGTGFHLPPSCHPYKPGCYRPEREHPGAPKRTGNGTPNTGTNCTYTTHGTCSPD